MSAFVSILIFIELAVATCVLYWISDSKRSREKKNNYFASKMTCSFCYEQEVYELLTIHIHPKSVYNDLSFMLVVR